MGPAARLAKRAAVCQIGFESKFGHVAGLGALALLARRAGQAKDYERAASLQSFGPSTEAPAGADDWAISASEIEICKRADGSDWVLGHGSQGKVYKGLRRGVQEVAVKKICDEGTGDVWLPGLEKEIGVLKKVSHDRNVVQYYGACLQDRASAMLVMEFMAVRAAALPCRLPCDPLVERHPSLTRTGDRR